MWSIVTIGILTLLAWGLFHATRSNARENGWRDAVRTLVILAGVITIIGTVHMGEHFESNGDGDPIYGGDTGSYVTDYEPTAQQRTERALRVFLFVFLTGGAGIAWNVAERTEKRRLTTSYPEMRARVEVAAMATNHDELDALSPEVREQVLEQLTINAMEREAA